MTVTAEKTKNANPTAAAHRTRRQNAEQGFVASRELADDLQAVLIDLIELHVQFKQAHWNIVGPNFRDLHLQLDEIVDAARGFSDVIAERMRAIHSIPDGRTSTVSTTTTLAEFPSGEINTAAAVDLVTERLDGVVATCRKVHDSVDSADPTSADLLHEIIASLEQFSWMVSAENRTARSS